MPVALLDEEYLRARGFVVNRCEEMSGGISNIVLAVDTPTERLVFKQSLEKLRVADEWLFDRARILNERRCMAWLDGRGAPEVRYADDENFIFGMTRVPDSFTLWKTALMDGIVDPDVAASAGRLLSRLHRDAAGDSSVAADFADQKVFLEGRIDPYHRFAARAHPDLAPLIEAEVTRMLSARRTLVHGDFSPKNILFRGAECIMLDFEVAHYGDPAFDVAFCLNHLILKTVHFNGDVRYTAAARAFWDAYDDRGFERDTIAELGCLLLARVDGKSKIEYITQDHKKNEVRQLARILLERPPAGMTAVWDLLA